MHRAETHLSPDDTSALRRLNELLKETFLLWDETWVGFSWRSYYYNHTQRVKALCLKIGEMEGADLRKLKYAAILHDITKRYDGKILTDGLGRPVFDENGFWRNELLLPKRENIVTRLYRRFNQFHKLHNVSGAFIARKILEGYGFTREFASSVSSIIRWHLKPDLRKEDSSQEILESKILYEADTIDANLGLTAFYRNVQIHIHYRTRRVGIATIKEYVSRIKPWIEKKSSITKLMYTYTGTRIARQRLERVKEVYFQLINELENHRQESLKYGLLAIIKGFMERSHDPNLEDEINYLLTVWIPRCKKTLKNESGLNTHTIFRNAMNFCHMLYREKRGEI